jgi:hypothetical protein
MLCIHHLIELAAQKEVSLEGVSAHIYAEKVDFFEDAAIACCAEKTHSLHADPEESTAHEKRKYDKYKTYILQRHYKRDYPENDNSRNVAHVRMPCYRAQTLICPPHALDRARERELEIKLMMKIIPASKHCPRHLICPCKNTYQYG